ncbi:hypothetical protein EXIGLDRAFT_723648, partial [Exidia glandulosa HHB12029]
MWLPSPTSSTGSTSRPVAESDASRRALDHLVLTIMHRCIAFEYTCQIGIGFTDFLLAIFGVPAPRLRRFCLMADSGEDELIFPERAQTIDLRTTWPMLRELCFEGICFPLHLLRVIGLERLRLIPGTCNLDEDCQLDQSFAHIVAELVRTNIALKEIEIGYLDGGGEYAPLEGLESYAPVDTVFSPSLRSVGFTGMPMAYVVPAHMIDHPPQLTNLTRLSLVGVLTCPGMAEENDTGAVAGLVRVLSGAPQLEDLEISDWIHSISMATALLPKARLPYLAKVHLTDMHPNWCYHILGALDAPSLLDVYLEVEYRYGTSNGLCAFFVPTPRMPWRFPSVVELEIVIGDYSSGYMPSLAAGLECEQMLRRGDWSNLEYLTICGHKWLSNAVLDVIIDALSDGSVAPCLRSLTIRRCHTPPRSVEGLGVFRPNRTERNASETADYLNDKRYSSTLASDPEVCESSGAEQGSDEDETRYDSEDDEQIEVEFNECDMCSRGGGSL